ncbi:hypothetical protein [Nonomuraea dietziae]|uniref:hypothetical protein n=1 Tax=Nonomuraea dietziae TaxID=65515 RepID=UPI0031D91099
MARKRQEGIDVDVAIRRPLFAFLGDTHVSVFERNPWLFDYPVIITECTFLEDTELERANRVGHTVWSQLRPTGSRPTLGRCRPDPLQPALLRPAGSYLLPAAVGAGGPLAAGQRPPVGHPDGHLA